MARDLWRTRAKDRIRENTLLVIIGGCNTLLPITCIIFTLNKHRILSVMAHWQFANPAELSLKKMYCLLPADFPIWKQLLSYPARNRSWLSLLEFIFHVEDDNDPYNNHLSLNESNIYVVLLQLIFLVFWNVIQLDLTVAKIIPHSLGTKLLAFLIVIKHHERYTGNDPKITKLCCFFLGKPQ